MLNLGLNLGEWLVFLVSLAALWGYDLLKNKMKPCFVGASPALRLAVIGALALVTLTFGMYGIGIVAEQFIYSKF